MLSGWCAWCFVFSMGVFSICFFLHWAAWLRVLGATAFSFAYSLRFLLCLCSIALGPGICMAFVFSCVAAVCASGRWNLLLFLLLWRRCWMACVSFFCFSASSGACSTSMGAVWPLCVFVGIVLVCGASWACCVGVLSGCRSCRLSSLYNALKFSAYSTAAVAD